ncbi:hypothetical protein D3C85_1821490 [compost metagenome]
MVKAAYKPVAIGYDDVAKKLVTVITSVGFKLPDNIEGYTAKAFLWDNIPSQGLQYWNDSGIPATTMQPYADVFTISQ